MYLLLLLTKGHLSNVTPMFGIFEISKIEILTNFIRFR